ncbi:MAG: hypothetical protein K2O00_00830 [Muribaculaceae bacterium]|nr:hypothetical protein [Muribaculaceae bacterium]
MNYKPVSGNNTSVGLMEAVINCFSRDGALYLPEHFPVIPRAFFNNIADMTLKEIGYVVANMLFGSDLDSETIKTVTDRALSYPIPFTRLSDNEFTLDLTQGPTGNYNDLGARFFAELFKLHPPRRHCNMVVTAQTGTLNAIAEAFHNIPDVTTFAVYPAGKLSPGLREKLFSYGPSVIPVEVAGDLRQCRGMVRELLTGHDPALQNLISGNSANVAILLPRVIYFFYAYALLRKACLPIDKVVVAIPTRNFGNLMSALIANRMGLPVSRFIAEIPDGETPEFISDTRLASLRGIASSAEIYSRANHPLAADEICIRLLAERIPPHAGRSQFRHIARISPTPAALKRIILTNS